MSVLSALGQWLVYTSRGRMTATACLVLGVFLIIETVVMPLYVRRGRELRIPDVAMMPFDEAQAMLVDHGLRVVREDRVDPGVEPGRVTRQLPLANSLVKTGRRVYLTVSLPAAPVSVPKIEGSPREAGITIANAQLRLGRTTFDVSTYYPEGVVMAQSPVPGTRVAAGSPIDITISLGRALQEPIVPSVVNLDAVSAEKEILKSGLHIGVVDTVIMPAYLPNTVLLQSEDAGSMLFPGDSVDILITALTGITVLRSAALRRMVDSMMVEDAPFSTP